MELTKLEKNNIVKKIDNIREDIRTGKSTEIVGKKVKISDRTLEKAKIMKILKIRFEEDGKIFFDSAIIGKDITEEQAQGLIKQGIARIEDVPDNEAALPKPKK